MTAFSDLRLARQVASFAASSLPVKIGIDTATKMAMIATTTKSSANVKPSLFFLTTITSHTLTALIITLFRCYGNKKSKET